MSDTDEKKEEQQNDENENEIRIGVATKATTSSSAKKRKPRMAKAAQKARNTRNKYKKPSCLLGIPVKKKSKKHEQESKTDDKPTRKRSLPITKVPVKLFANTCLEGAQAQAKRVGRLMIAAEANKYAKTLVDNAHRYGQKKVVAVVVE